MFDVSSCILIARRISENNVQGFNAKSMCLECLFDFRKSVSLDIALFVVKNTWET